MGKFYDGLYEVLSLHVRYSAWLNTPTERPARSINPPRSRLEQFRIDRKEEDYSPDMPPVSAGHLILYLWEIGPILADGMGSRPINHAELLAWSELIGIELQPWEARFILRLSQDYLMASRAAEKPDYPSPWVTATVTQEQRDAVSRQVQNSLRSLMRAGQ